MKNIKKFSTFLNEKINFYDKPRFEIKIKKSGSDQYWYKDLIGEIFVAIDVDGKFKIVPESFLEQKYPSYEKLEPAPIYYINKEDVDVIKKL